MELNEQQLKRIILDNQTAPEWIQEARAYSEELFALVEGKDFIDLLTKVEHLEGDQKATVRRKFARSVKDMFERLGRLTDNVYHSTGGVKRYTGLSDAQKEKLESVLDDIRSGQSLQEWLEYNWKDLYHIDPNGLIFLEYMEGKAPYPTYKSINSIRTYLPNGQKCEFLLFEPKELDDNRTVWRLVDDVKDYTVIQSGNTLVIDEDLTFEHEFGCVPAIINSNINKIGNDNIKVSPYDKVIEISKEYLQNGSVKTLYKLLQGFPKHWRYTAPCPDCHGTGKNGETICRTCDGTGESKRNDVTDEIRLSIPENDDVVLAPNIAGYVTPDLETWERFNEELKLLEDTITLTHWGAIVNTQAVATATEIVIDTQPTIQRLNKYSDVAQRVESMITEMIANHLFLEKDKYEKIASINYGRNFIIEPLNIVLQRYQESKAAGDNATILDRQYNEYLMSKYKSDPKGLKVALLKSAVEPYIHFNVEQVAETMGTEEAQKKILFDDYWKTVLNYDQEVETIKRNFEAWFEQNKKRDNLEQTETQTEG